MITFWVFVCGGLNRFVLMFTGMSEGSSAYILTPFDIKDEDWRIFFISWTENWEQRRVLTVSI